MDNLEIENVIVKQPPMSDDFINDPEAGPSGLQTMQTIQSENNVNREILRYQNHSSSDDDSEDEGAAIWRPQESNRFNRNDEDSNDTRYSNHSWRNDIPAAPESPSVTCEIIPLTSNNNRTEEIIDLSGSDSVPSNTVHNPSTNTNGTRRLEVLTAPDLQLDWLSDSSSDNEIVRAIRSQSPDRDAALNFTQSNLNTLHATNDLPPIDLTASDDEEAIQSHGNGNDPSIVESRAVDSGNERKHLMYGRRFVHNMYTRNRCPLKASTFQNEQRLDKMVWKVN